LIRIEKEENYDQSLIFFNSTGTGTGTFKKWNDSKARQNNFLL
jgi:hypothetical protein